jgi:hypothetical protein
LADGELCGRLAWRLAAQTAFEQLGQVNDIRCFALLFAGGCFNVLNLAFVGFLSTRAMILSSNSSR